VNSLPDKSSRRWPAIDPPDDGPTRIVLGDDPSLMADSHASTVELQPSPSRGSSAVVITNEDKTVISKRALAEEPPPAIHVGPLESRKSLEGETLDHFKLETFVGGGGMGAVYRSHDTRLNRLVAVKILSRDQSDSETVRRFRNEAQSAARLDHPHIARVYYVGEDKGWNFIVFEFIEGVNLREIVEKNGPLSIEESLDYTLQVAEALDHASARDVVHRDIKPSNVLVTEDGSVKLVDMGLARLHQIESGADDLTQSGVTLGTFDYISPEQARDPRLADVRSDIYSLGCTLYFMLVGRPPFPEGTALQKLLRHNGDDPPDVRLFRPDTPEDVVAILTRCLAKKPDQRFQSPAELMAAINRVSQRLHLNLGASSSSRTPIHWPQPAGDQMPWWQRWLPLAAAALVLVALALLPDTWPGQTRAVPALPDGQATRPAIPTESPSTPQTKGSSSTPQDDEPTESTVVASDTSNDEESPSVAPSNNAVAATTDTPPQNQDASETTPRIDSPSTDVVTTPRKKIVVRSDGVAEDDAVVLPTFVEACAYASTHPEVELIELAFNTKQQIYAASPEIASKRLTIQAAEGFTPELVFKPSTDALPEERRLIRLTMPGSNVKFVGVRVLFNVPTPSRSDWTLIQFAPESTLELESCVVTIANSVASVRNAPQVAFFEPGPQVTTNSNADSALAPPRPQIAVERSVLRGDAVVLRLPEDIPVRFRLSDSFVATGDRVFETAGAFLEPDALDPIELALERSTIYAAKGLALSGFRGDFTHHLEARVEQRNCVIVGELSSPLLEYRESVKSQRPLITLEASENFYPRNEILLRQVYQQDGRETTIDTNIGDLQRGSVTGPPADVPTHELSVSDYLLKSPANASAGCDPALLPKTATDGTSRRPVMGATNMSTMKPDAPMSLMPPIMDEKPTMKTTP